MALWLVYSSPDRAVPACIAAVPFLFFSGGEIEQEGKQAGEQRSAPGMNKKLERNGNGVGGMSGEKGSEWVAPLLLSFYTRSQFRSLCPLIFEKLATKARAIRVRDQAGDTVLCS